MVLNPEFEGTDVKLATDEKQITDLLKSGMKIADIVIPKTTPPKINQLSLQF